MNPFVDIGGKWIPPDEADEDQDGSPPLNLRQMLKELGKNGIVVSGVVTWIQVNKNIAAKGLWKQHAETSWSDEEVSNAKSALLNAGGERLVQLVPGMRICRKNVAGRRSKEVNDIIEAINALEESNTMPLVLCSSEQLGRCPQSQGSIGPNTNMGDVMTKVVSIEETLSKFMDSSRQQMETMSAELKRHAEPRMAPTAQPVTPGTPAKKRKFGDEGAAIDVEAARSYAGIAGMTPLNQPKLLKHTLQNIIEKKGVEAEKDKSKKKGKNAFHGNARSLGGDATGETILAADVDLVATGVAKDAEPDQLKAFLVAKGIDVVNVECLTKQELLDENKVRCKTMKVTVKAAQHDLAMNPDLWPLRVGVRHFRAPSSRSANGNSWASQSSQSGGIGKSSQSGGKGKSPGENKNHQHKKNHAGNARESPASSISVQNKFEILGTLMDFIKHP